MIRSNDWDALQSVAAKPGIAHVHDGLGATPLRFMLAVASDDTKPANVRQLITAGADVNSVDVYGDSVLDWALKFRQPEIIAALTRAGAKSNRPATPPIRPANFKPLGPADGGFSQSMRRPSPSVRL